MKVHYYDIKFRCDYNRRPIVFRDPSGQKMIRWHPYYCYKGGHYGRIYEYRLLNNDWSIDPNFSAKLYDLADDIMTNPNIFQNTMDAINRIRVNQCNSVTFQVLVFLEQTKQVNVTISRMQVDLEEYGLKMKSGYIPNDEYGYIQSGDDIFIIKNADPCNDQFLLSEKEKGYSHSPSQLPEKIAIPIKYKNITSDGLFSVFWKHYTDKDKFQGVVFGKYNRGILVIEL